MIEATARHHELSEQLSIDRDKITALEAECRDLQELLGAIPPSVIRNFSQDLKDKFMEHGAKVAAPFYSGEQLEEIGYLDKIARLEGLLRRWLDDWSDGRFKDQLMCDTEKELGGG